MKIKLLTVGKIADRAIKEKCADYDKRINHFFPFELISVRDEKIKNLSEMEIKNREAERILKKVSPDDWIIALEKSGEQMSSEAFAEFLDQTTRNRKKNPLFIIGGPLGLGDHVLGAANKKISLSHMTFTHELAALFIFEQIYRALNILRGTKYHK
ncbi:23S rRNA (pseudouridine(1915)-N(3))-methyltransferase RlmH [candidate division KSB1 bacterium]|nr:23S rRNA (pseudouridine(1915)-N(3))-methyltransferase RlmH [candidate division KSB1 bacterium]